jgi:hypothetical protein
VHAPSAADLAVQEPIKATGSVVDRLKGQSRSTDSDLDRTPTKYNHFTASARDNGSQQYSVENSIGQTRPLKSRQSGEGGTLQRLSVSVNRCH